MSMKTLTALQLLHISGLYVVMTLLLPAVLFFRKISSKPFSVRFMIYQTVGNFYMITLVLALQLLHISNRYTLIGFTVCFFCFAYAGLHGINPKEGLSIVSKDLVRLAEGQYGLRLYTGRMIERMRCAWKKLAAWIWNRFFTNLADVLLLLMVFAAYMVIYGRNAFEQYGYCASDIVVHNYWINYMSRGEPFVAGVYPLGFHCVIYYFHEVFHIDTYVLLRLFWVVQTFVIHLMLAAFIRVCCRTKYVAYVGLGIYLMVNLFRINTYSRYFSSLPQEFGMIFILPALAFLFLFFQYYKKPSDLEDEEERIYLLDEVLAQAAEDMQECETQKRPVRGIGRICEAIRREFSCEGAWYLLLFALNFSLTLSIHFYNTMIAGIFCVGTAVGYGFRLFRRPYFGRVMLAGTTAIVIAVLPLLLAFVSGIPPEGSLYWGVNIINGTAKQQDAVRQEKNEEQSDDQNQSFLPLKEVRNIYMIKKGKVILNGEMIAREAEIDGGRVVSKGDVTVGNHQVKGGQMVADARLLEKGKVIYEGMFLAVGYDLPETESDPEHTASDKMCRVKTKVERIVSATLSTIRGYLIYAEYEWVCRLTPLSVCILGVLSVLFFLLRQTDAAARMLSTAVYMTLMTVMFVAPELGLPELMDANGRTCIYYAYSLIVLWCFCIDGILQLMFGRFARGRVSDAVSFLLIPALAVTAAVTGTVKKTYAAPGLEPNGAVVCLTNIIRDNPDETWTIVSANDEMRMGEDHGFHYETDTFLRNMEQKGSSGEILIPTKNVFFFIEKIPIDYTEPYEDSGQKVSAKGAAQQLPVKTGIEMYKGRKRWIEMSRMYYWAKQFQSLYPNEMKVYYETDDFICYRVAQNEYSLFNFAIDYRYNTANDKKE